MKKKILISSAFLGVIATGAFFLLGGSKNSSEPPPPKGKGQKGNSGGKALAGGTIEPENEISIKSKVSGVVKHIFADAGAHVKEGQPLLEVRPDPTPLELAGAKRQVQLAQVDLDNLTKDDVRELD